MARPKTFNLIKQPWEAYYLYVEFEGMIGTKTATDISVTATLDGVDATSDLLTTEDTYQSTDYIYFWAKENTSITEGTYKIKVRVTLDDDTQLEEDVYLIVEDI